MKSIILYGGSFNPPHLGHVHIAEAAISELSPDVLLIMPAGIPPHKKLLSQTPAPQHRFMMAKLAFEHLKGVEVSDWEIRRGGKNYTIDTVNEILKNNADFKITLLLGTDMFMSVQTWYRAESLLKKCDIAVLMRNKTDDIGKMKEQAEYLQNRYGSVVRILKAHPVEISSTQVRENGGDVSSMIPPAVRQYILENNLYGFSNQG